MKVRIAVAGGAMTAMSDPVAQGDSQQAHALARAVRLARAATGAGAAAVGLGEGAAWRCAARSGFADDAAALAACADAAGPAAELRRVLRAPDGAVLGVLCVAGGIEGGFERDAADGIAALDDAADLCQDVINCQHTERRLLQAERLGTIGRMTGGIAHDFNNLLTVISISLELAEGMADARPDLLALLRAAGEAAHKGAELTQQLLAYARRQPLQPIPVSPGVFAAALLDMLPRVLGERYRIESRVAAAMPPFLADPAQLETALLNLFLNARDAMPDGGAIRFEIGMVALAAGAADDSDAMPPGDYAMIAVADDGAGMSEETRARMFEPFFTTKPPGRGTGLGLSMVQGFARQSGGRVAVDSTPGRGTVVRLLLPMAPEPPAAADADADADADAYGDADADAYADAYAGAQPAARALPPLAVLVVEDEDDVRGVACRMCADLGLAPTPAASAEAALACLEGGARFGLLFTDLVLAGAMDGAALARRAQALDPALPVLFTSGYSDGSTYPRACMPPTDPLLAKPYSRGQFVEAVDAVLRGATAAQAPG